ncbi:MAG TPA: hypothetical protein VEK33_04950 [Terriglobales bacterium]|nr:hypothetical protein [Terriglobales bacterium]
MARGKGRGGQHRLSAMLGYSASAFAIGGSVLLLYGLAWTYSTHRYLKGFADAIIPLDGTPQQKTEALLTWLRYEPERSGTLLQGGSATLRDPVNIVQNGRLLKFCGSAGNAFINLADVAGLNTRRLLLLDRAGSVMHVVVEVEWAERWVSVDPQLPQVFRDHSGRPLTKEELRDPGTFQDAISRMPNYNPAYSFERTAYLHLKRIPFVGDLGQRTLDQFFPGWEQAIDWGYFAENPSLWPVLWSLPLLLLSVLVRVVNGYGRDWFSHNRVNRVHVLRGSVSQRL